MLILTNMQTVFSWWKRSFHSPHALHVYIVFPYLFHTKMPPAGYKIARHLGFLCLLELMFLLFLIPITAGISGVFALKLWCIINCKIAPLSDRISAWLSRRDGKQKLCILIITSCISLVIKIVIPLGGKVEQKSVSVDGAMNITDDTVFDLPGYGCSVLPNPSKTAYVQSWDEIRLCTNIETSDSAMQSKMKHFTYEVPTHFS